MNWNLVVVLVVLLGSCSECSKSKFKCRENLNNNSTCRAERVDETPWSTDSEQPAPTPRWAGHSPVKFIKHRVNNTQRFRLKIKWKQEASKIKKFVTGYFLEIKPHDHMGAGFKTRFYINKDKLEKDIAYFTYEKFGNLKVERIYPNVGYIITLHSLPLYNEGTHYPNLPLFKDIRSPHCPDDEELNKYPMRVCPIKESTTISYYEYTNYDDYNEYNETFDPEPVGAVKGEKKIFRIDIILLCSSFASLFCLLIYIYHKWDILKRKIKLCANSGYQNGIPLATSGGRILVLVPTAGMTGRPREWEFTQDFATSLNNTFHDDVIGHVGCGGKVECNLWNMSRSSCDPRSWLCDVITKSDFSRLVMVNNGSGGSIDVRNDPYWAAVDYIRSGGHLRCNAFQLTTVNFSGDDVIAMDCDFIKAQNRISHVTHHRMPDDVDALMHELTGHAPDDVISTKLRQLADKVIELRTSTV